MASLSSIRAKQVLGPDWCNALSLIKDEDLRREVARGAKIISYQET
jgi:hypothetical protein